LFVDVEERALVDGFERFFARPSVQLLGFRSPAGENPVRVLLDKPVRGSLCRNP
jgi:hypothetical protein